MVGDLSDLLWYLWAMQHNIQQQSELCLSLKSPQLYNTKKIVGPTQNTGRKAPENTKKH